AEAVERSTDELLEARARVEQQFVRLQTHTGAIDDAQRVADAAVKVFEEHEDDSGQSRAWCLKATIAWIVGQAAKADEAWQRAAEHALRAGDKREVFEMLDWRASAAVGGPTSVDEAIELCLQIRAKARCNPVAVAVDEDLLAQVVGRGASAKILARQGRGDEAEALAREAVELAASTDFLTHCGEAFLDLAEVLQLNGQPAEAENAVRAGLEFFER